MKIIHNAVVQNTYVVWKYHQQNFGFFDRELPILCKSCAKRGACLWATLNFCQPFDELLHFFVESDIAFGELFDDFFIYQVWCYKMENKKEQKMLLEIHIYVLDDDLYDLPSSQLICCSFSYLDSISLLKITMAWLWDFNFGIF